MSHLLIDVIILLITYFKDQCFLNCTSACKLIICLTSRICNNEDFQKIMSDNMVKLCITGAQWLSGRVLDP